MLGRHAPESQMQLLGRSVPQALLSQALYYQHLGHFGKRSLRVAPYQALCLSFAHLGMPPRKKRASVAEGDDADDVYDPKKASKSGENDGDAEKPRKKSRTKKEKEPEEVHTAHEGPAWTVVPPSLLYRCYSNYLREWVGRHFLRHNMLYIFGRSHLIRTV